MELFFKYGMMSDIILSSKLTRVVFVWMLQSDPGSGPSHRMAWLESEWIRILYFLFDSLLNTLLVI